MTALGGEGNLCTCFSLSRRKGWGRVARRQGSSADSGRGFIGSARYDIGRGDLGCKGP